MASTPIEERPAPVVTATSEWGEIVQRPGGPPPKGPIAEPPVRIIFTDEEVEAQLRQRRERTRIQKP